MYADILINRIGGQFYRDLADGTVQSLSDPIDIGAGEYRVIPFADLGEYLILHSGGQPTGEGNPTMHKVAKILAARFEDDPATRAARLADQIRREMTEALQAGPSRLSTYSPESINAALADGTIVAITGAGLGYPLYELAPSPVAAAPKATVFHLAAAHERNDAIACEGWYYPRAYRHESTAVYGDVTCPACISEVTFTIAAADPETVYA